mmetsp:Transcript_12923/g.33111  ORF Transcript_12923/g.33111 Transcript_12923/m.33111 type:complete len:261 (-) Transcript_12923:1114-1896(-)
MFMVFITPSVYDVREHRLKAAVEQTSHHRSHHAPVICPMRGKCLARILVDRGALRSSVDSALPHAREVDSHRAATDRRNHPKRRSPPLPYLGDHVATEVWRRCECLRAPQTLLAPSVPPSFMPPMPARGVPSAAAPAAMPRSVAHGVLVAAVFMPPPPPKPTRRALAAEAVEVPATRAGSEVLLGYEWTEMGMPGPVSMSKPLNRSIATPKETSATTEKMTPNVRSGRMDAARRGATAQSVVSPEASVEPERARSVARDL